MPHRAAARLGRGWTQADPPVEDSQPPRLLRLAGGSPGEPPPSVGVRSGIFVEVRRFAATKYLPVQWQGWQLQGPGIHCGWHWSGTNQWRWRASARPIEPLRRLSGWWHRTQDRAKPAKT